MSITVIVVIDICVSACSPVAILTLEHSRPAWWETEAPNHLSLLANKGNVMTWTGRSNRAGWSHKGRELQEEGRVEVMSFVLHQKKFRNSE